MKRESILHLVCDVDIEQAAYDSAKLDIVAITEYQKVAGAW
jgi:hypothetical protein